MNRENYDKINTAIVEKETLINDRNKSKISYYI